MVRNAKIGYKGNFFIQFSFSFFVRLSEWRFLLTTHLGQRFRILDAVRFTFLEEGFWLGIISG